MQSSSECMLHQNTAPDADCSLLKRHSKRHGSVTVGRGSCHSVKCGATLSLCSSLQMNELTTLGNSHAHSSLRSLQLSPLMAHRAAQVTSSTCSGPLWTTPNVRGTGDDDSPSCAGCGLSSVSDARVFSIIGQCYQTLLLLCSF